jgi:uncharacterized RDD family membrane protein YckC
VSRSCLVSRAAVAPRGPVKSAVRLAPGQFTLHLPLDSMQSWQDWTMATGEPRRIGVSIELKPHAYDPQANPELFDGVLARRLIAFLIDLIIVAIPVILVAVFMLATTIATLGLAAFFFALLSPLFWPLIVIWAICYYGLTFGSPASATIGMRVMDLEMRTWYGAPAYFVLGAVHAVVFWLTVSFLTPLVLLVGFFNQRRRLLHDMLIGTVVINNPARAQALRGPGWPHPPQGV